MISPIIIFLLLLLQCICFSILIEFGCDLWFVICYCANIWNFVCFILSYYLFGIFGALWCQLIMSKSSPFLYVFVFGALWCLLDMVLILSVQLYLNIFWPLIDIYLFYVFFPLTKKKTDVNKNIYLCVILYCIQTVWSSFCFMLSFFGAY